MIDLKEASFSALISQLWFILSKKKRYQFWVLCILIVFSSFAEVISLGAILPFLAVMTSPQKSFENSLLQPFIEILSINSANELLFFLALSFSVAAILSGILKLLTFKMQTNFAHSIGADISVDIYRRTLYQPYTTHMIKNSSELIAGIQTKANHIVAYIIMPITTILNSFVMIVSVLSALVFISPFVALSSFFGFALIYVFVIFFTKKRLAFHSKQMSTKAVKVMKILQEGLGGIRDVIIDGAHETYAKIYKNEDVPHRKSMASVSVISESPRFLVESFTIALMAFIAYQLSSNSNSIIDAVPILGAIAMGAQRLLPVLQRAYASYSTMLGGKESLRDVITLIYQPLPQQYIDSNKNNELEFKRKISVKNLSFSYPDTNIRVLDNIDFEITKGTCTGIIGTTGSGKSSLLDVIMNLLPATEGGLYIDDTLIDSSYSKSWQSKISHVPQVIFLSDSTLAENIAFGVPAAEVDEEKLIYAANLAQLSETINLMPDKFNTLVGERGARLSGGQRQRIGIARAIYKDSEVIILDEATSALDDITESKVIKAIEDLNKTVLMVAHRLTTLKNCDKVIQLDKGKVSKIGTYLDIIG
jgi:ABC-type multidrug transport system fused ATPase/permease subunit